MSKPVRLRMQGGNTVVTIPREILAESHLQVGHYVTVIYDREKHEIILRQTSSLGYFTTAEKKSLFSKRDREIEVIHKWLEENPNATISDYFDVLARNKKRNVN